MNRVTLRALRPLQARTVAQTQRVQFIQRRKVGNNWVWHDIDPRLRWTNTKLGRADPATQMGIIPLNNRWGLMAQLKFMLPFYIVGLCLWVYIDQTEPIWIDNSLFTYVEKEE
eukprot:CAMPEP_0202689736 /NCGR_PEP_ID=MMETSP1385-20130828/4932_1 /ASSEMBLY_ACC=CAM_ASM_000861 /TAXON_ID=933848 /ORGANISM="Elphidium margaritaceum" /LENGTH=112 /DNA_ID=CAMNT_0049344915 /DNA_START=85 /DNA_END=423 /DNA_ORIENTATION=-